MNKVELYINGNLVGIFSSSEAALDYAHANYPGACSSIFPLGTTIKSDL